MTLNRTELIAKMAAQIYGNRNATERNYTSMDMIVDESETLLREVESRQPPVEAPETPSAAYAHGKSDGFEAGLDAAIAEIVRYADECNTEDLADFSMAPWRYARAGLNGARFRIEALKSKPSQAAEGEKET